MLSDKLRASTARKKSQYLAVGHELPPYVTVYPWSSSGFGTKFANPSNLPTGGGGGAGVDFHPDGTAIAFTRTETPSITAYSWSKNGFGNKYSNPVTLPPNYAFAVKFNPTGNAIAVSHQGAPFITVYRWSIAGFGTKFTNPSILPPSTVYDVAFSPDNTTIAVTHDDSPYVSAYAWSNTGFGNKFANPATLPAGGALRVKFNPSSTAIVVTNNSGGTGIFMTGYPWSSSGFGTRFSNPEESVYVRRALSFNNKGDIVITGDDNSTVTFTSFNPSGFAGQIGSTGPLGMSQITDVSTSPNDNNLAITGSISPYIRVYPFSGTNLGSPFANPATLPPSAAKSLKFLEV
jgi:WD40 repeat protein